MILAPNRGVSRVAATAGRWKDRPTPPRPVSPPESNRGNERPALSLGAHSGSARTRA